MMINRLRIKYDKKADSLSEAYSVWTPDGKCWEDRLTLNQAVAYCQDCYKTDIKGQYPVSPEMDQGHRFCPGFDRKTPETLSIPRKYHSLL